MSSGRVLTSRAFMVDLLMGPGFCCTGLSLVYRALMDKFGVNVAAQLSAHAE